MKNEITLEDVLACREKRAKLQIKLTQAYRCPLISFTMNIAGPVKTSPLIRRAFYLGLQMLEDKLTGKSILYKKQRKPTPDMKRCMPFRKMHRILRKFAYPSKRACPSDDCLTWTSSTKTEPNLIEILPADA